MKRKKRAIHGVEVRFAGIGPAIRAVRVGCRLTRKQLAQRSKVPVSTIVKAEAITGNPTLATLVKMMQAMGYVIDLQTIPREMVGPTSPGFPLGGPTGDPT